jgi:DNA-nicking Smr family endonuclease
MLKPTTAPVSARLNTRQQRAARVDAARAAAATPPPTSLDPQLEAAFAARLTIEEAMRKAFQAVEAGNVYDGKYLGVGLSLGDVIIYDPLHDPNLMLADAVDASLLPDAPASPDEALFRDLVGTVDRRVHEKHIKHLQNRDWVGFRWRSVNDLDKLTNEQLGEPDLSDPQRKLLRRSRKFPIREMTVRLQTLEQAMIAVDLFVRRSQADSVEFVRIITGKGIRSADGPVLKPAVIAWCQDIGRTWVRAWAPETDRSGDFGSIVLELKPPSSGRR